MLRWNNDFSKDKFRLKDEKNTNKTNNSQKSMGVIEFDLHIYEKYFVKIESLDNEKQNRISIVKSISNTDGYIWRGNKKLNHS